MGFEGSELNEENGEGAIVEPNDSDRFISGGERSEETVRRLLGGVLYVGFAIAEGGRGELVCRRREPGALASLYLRARQR